MTVIWKPVISSMVSEVGADDESNDLYIRWSGGKQGVYIGAGDLADELSRAPSVGRMINSDIKPFYPYRQI